MNINNSSDKEINEYLIDITCGYLKSKALNIVIELGISNILSTGQKTCKELSEQLKLDEDTLYGLLRALSTIGIFKEDENQDRLFSNTNVSKKLIQVDDQNDILNICKLQTSLSSSFNNHFDKTIKTGKPMGIPCGYNSMFDYYNSNEKEANIFYASMTGYTTNQIKSILQKVDFTNYKTIVDLGGSKGEFLKEIVKVQDSNSKSIESLLNFDLPCPLKYNENETNDQRYKDIEGDFFTSEYPVGNCYILKSILHMFKNEKVLLILNSISNATKGNDCDVLLFEYVVSKNTSTIPFYMEFQLMNCFGGKERSELEWRQVIEKSDFQIKEITVIPNTNHLCMIKLTKK